MPMIAILGAGAAGATLAQTLACRDRVREVRLVDPEGSVAAGKALDILQSSPVEQFSTRVTSSTHWSAAVGADVVVIADSAAASEEHAGDAGLALLRQLVAAGVTAPFLFAGAQQRSLMARAHAELHIPTARLAGSAPLALESALRALAGLALDGSGVEVTLRVVGIPPRGAVVAWEDAGADGQRISGRLPPHEIGALSARIPGLWPPGPYALGSAAARVVEAIALGARRRFTCFVALGRSRVAAMPVELGPGGVRRVLEPSLTVQERTMLENALERADV